MWRLLWIPVVLVLHDYLKSPIDTLYFQNPLRPLIGMRNTLVDLICHKFDYNVMEYANLWFVRANYNKILYEYEVCVSKAKKKYFHELDPWFKKNAGYYYYEVKDFPEVQKIIDQIPCVDKDTAKFAVIEGPMTIAPHRAESNLMLRYHLTIKGGKHCVLYTSNGGHHHEPGKDYLFDHSRVHSLVKRSFQRRVVLILDVHRF